MPPAVTATLNHYVRVQVWHSNAMEAPAYKRETEGRVIDLTVFTIPMANYWRCCTNNLVQKFIGKSENEGFVHIENINFLESTCPEGCLLFLLLDSLMCQRGPNWVSASGQLRPPFIIAASLSVIHPHSFTLCLHLKTWCI